MSCADVVHGVRGVGGMCERCMCLARGGVGGCELVRRLGLCFTKGECGTCVCVWVVMVCVVGVILFIV